MTSEVLVLNKGAVVLAADSALTTSQFSATHPRYSKSAIKIFELAQCGNVAVMIYGSALLDAVPWEVAVKLFRRKLGKTTYPKVSDYLTALVDFLNANDQLFPPAMRSAFVEQQFDIVLTNIVKEAHATDAALVDTAVALADRQAKWRAIASGIRQRLTASGVAAPLTQAALTAVLANATWTARAQAELAKVPSLDAIDPAELVCCRRNTLRDSLDLLQDRVGGGNPLKR